MLAGAEITAEARAAAERLIAGARAERPSCQRPRQERNVRRRLSPKSRPRPSTRGSRPKSPSMTGAIIRRTRRPSPMPNMTRCASATTRSRRAFRNCARCESLTQRVGAAPSARFAKVRHAVPMLSLDNAFADEDVRRFRRPHPPLPAACRGRATIAFTAEPKIDGLSMSLRYENGELVTGRDARRRHRGRGRHRQCENAQGHPAPAQGRARAGGVRGARRGLYDQGAISLALNARSRPKPASRSSPIRAIPPPARCASSTRRSPPRGRSAFFAYAWGEMSEMPAETQIRHDRSGSSAAASRPIR